jgi:hypothetical protein
MTSMNREQVKNQIIEYFKQQLQLKKSRPEFRLQIQLANIVELFREQSNNVPSYMRAESLGVVNEVVHEFINTGLLYPGQPGDYSQFFPWLTITEHGKQVFMSEDWLPYDPDGYIKALKERVPELDDVTLAYIGESVAAFNRRHLLAATITLGVASENIMLLLIEAYQQWIKDPKRKASFEKKIADRWIATQYKEFKQQFGADVKQLPKELQGDWETYLDGVFNFIRLRKISRLCVLSAHKYRALDRNRGLLHLRR